MTRLLFGHLAAAMLPRASWDAAPVDGPVDAPLPVRGVTVHHTRTHNQDEAPLQTVRRVQRFHMETRGWSDIGYHLLVLPDGRLVEGRAGVRTAVAPSLVVGAHAHGVNHGTLGVALLGRFDDEPPTDAATSMLTEVLRTVAATAGLQLDARGEVALHGDRRLPAVVTGHRDVGDTTCPGDGLAGILPALVAAATPTSTRSGQVDR